MEPTSSETQETGESLVVEGPELLSPGQNFFDQQPFSLFIAQLESQGIDPSVLYTALVSRANRWEEYTTENEIRQRQHDGEFNPGLSMRERDKALEDRLKNTAGGKIIAPKLIPIIRGLEEFPLILEYIRAQKDSSFYSYSGEPLEGVDPDQFQLDRPRSYGAWTERQRSSSSRQILHGIEEVFPQQTSQTVRDTVPAMKPATRRWAIMKQAGIIPGKG